MKQLRIFLSRLAACLTQRTAPVEHSPQSGSWKSVYNETGCGTLEIVSGQTALIPWELIQTVTVSRDISSHEFVFDIMAEYHRDLLRFPPDKAAHFITALQRYLDGFDIAEAASAIESVNIGNKRVMYRSPYYDCETTLRP